MGLTIAAVLLGSAAVFYVDFVLELSSLALLSVVGLFSASMWMPYLMALIYYNGLWKKLNYEPLTAAKPDWVGRAVVAHNNSLENFMLFGIAVILATLLQIPDVETVLWCKLYFAMRMGHFVFTVAPPIFMLKTAFWMMGWIFTAVIYVKCYMAA